VRACRAITCSWRTPHAYDWFLEHRGCGLPLPELTGCNPLAIDDRGAACPIVRGRVDAANPMCRHETDRKTNCTAASVVDELSLPPVLHRAPGPPCLTPLSRFEFTPAGDD